MTASVVLAPRVRLDGRVLVDADRDLSVPLNPTAAWLLGRLVAGADAESVAVELAERTATSPDTVAGDLAVLLERLGDAYLVEVRSPAPRLRWTLWVAALSLAAGQMPAWPRSPARRHALDASGLGAVVRTTAGAMLRPAAGLAGLIFAGAALPVVAGAGFAGAAFLAAVAALSGAAFAAHEVAHATAAVAAGATPFLVTGRCRAVVVHRPLDGQALIAAAGPLVPAAVGAAAWVALAGRCSPAVVVAATLPWLVHAVGLTALTHDGRNLMRVPASASPASQAPGGPES